MVVLTYIKDEDIEEVAKETKLDIDTVKAIAALADAIAGKLISEQLFGRRILLLRLLRYMTQSFAQFRTKTLVFGKNRKAFWSLLSKALSRG